MTGVGLAVQFLESYKSVTLQSMATAFGVSVDFIDQELVDFIVAGRLPAKIDKVQALSLLAAMLCDTVVGGSGAYRGMHSKQCGMIALLFLSRAGMRLKRGYSVLCRLQG